MTQASISRTLWCASYPKSGNTWLRAILRTLWDRAPLDINKLGMGSGHADHCLQVLGVREANLSDAHIRQVRRAAWASEVASTQPWIARKTHEAWLPSSDGYPPCWQPPDARCIYVVRDPRDVAVSWAHHLGVSHQRAAELLNDPDFSAHNDWSALTEYRTGTWSQHVQSWVHQRDVPALVVRYEDLGQAGEVRRVAQWVGLSIEATEADAVVAECSFSNMAAAEILGGFVEAAAADRVFFRRGQTGTWREELDPKLARIIEAEHGQIMEQFGYHRES